MGRPKTIHVDRLGLLRVIAQQVVKNVAGIDRELAEIRAEYTVRDWQRVCDLNRERQAVLSPEQNLQQWAGRALTDSERIRHQQAVRQLESDGLLVRAGRRVSLTAAGWQAAGLEQPK